MQPADAGLERPLPYNLEAERGVLGAILLDNSALDTAKQKLNISMATPGMTLVEQDEPHLPSARTQLVGD